MSYPYYHLIYKTESSESAESFLGYAEVYKNALQILLNEYAKNPPRHVFSLAPILSLLRQYIELQLKGILKNIEPSYKVKRKKGHDIIDLYSEALSTIDKKWELKRFGQASKDCEKFIKCLGNIDASIGRYPETIDEKDFKIDPWLEEKIMTLVDFTDIANKVIGDLEGMEGFVECQKQNEQENWANQESG